MSDFETDFSRDARNAREFDEFVNAETLIASPPAELTLEQIISRLNEIEDKVRSIVRTMRRQEEELQTTRIFMESLPGLITGLRKEIATDISTRRLQAEGHKL